MSSSQEEVTGPSHSRVNGPKPAVRLSEGVDFEASK